MKISDIAAGRAGDKGDVLDLTLVAYDDEGYRTLAQRVHARDVEQWLAHVAPSPVVRYELANVRALKFVAGQALAGGVYRSLHAGMHWQKAAIWLLLDKELPDA
ncbi:MAG: hypothetical protein M0Z92_04985 [Actinomycetota bacterium]|nr:hypothetical protein [Actinomycetota bacterium]